MARYVDNQAHYIIANVYAFTHRFSQYVIKYSLRIDTAPGDVHTTYCKHATVPIISFLLPVPRPPVRLYVVFITYKLRASRTSSCVF